MTVSYTADVATCKKFGSFIKLMARWKGSIYKLVWLDLVTFSGIYYALNFTYQFGLSPEAQKVFEHVVHYCHTYGSLIPLSFVLGFYVGMVMKRWWDQYLAIPWPDSIAVFVSAHVHGQDERGRVMRRTIMRYVCICQTLVFIMISPSVKKRFPTHSYLVDAGLLMDSEREIIESFDKAFPHYAKHWMPIVWAASIVTRARREGRIRDDFAVKTLIDEMNKFRVSCGYLLYYDWITVPLVYTQVVTLAVYSFFLSNVFSNQWIQERGENISKYFPIFTLLQFFFYMGWLKVAETLINPFGDDDDDFEINWMIDRNIQVSYLIVDEMHHDHPELVKDQYWDDVFPTELPYPKEVDIKRGEPPEPSTGKVDFTKQTADLSSIKVDKGDKGDNVDNLDSVNTKHSLVTLTKLQKQPSHYSHKIRHLISREEKLYDDRHKLTDSLSSSSSESTHASYVPKKKDAFEKISDVAIPEQTLLSPPRSLHELFRQKKKLYKSDSSLVNLIDSFQPEGDQDEIDDFDRLKEEREKERLERLKQKLTNVAQLTQEPQTGEVVEADDVAEAIEDDGDTVSHYVSALSMAANERQTVTASEQTSSQAPSGRDTTQNAADESAGSKKLDDKDKNKKS